MASRLTHGRRQAPTLHILGVRHHSPACARLVRHVIRETRPRFVLIEGPCDMNGRIGELALAHELPIAIFSYLKRGHQRRAAWSPFCDYSPEWVALDSARQVGAEALFCDLPSWHDAFADMRNRYADHRGVAAREMADAYVEALCERFALDDMDALWDHLFEQPAPMDELRTRLEAYFERLRDDAPATYEDAPREAFMARTIRWALRHAGEGHDAEDGDTKGGDVVVVCGGYHAPALARAIAQDTLDQDQPEDPAFPDIPPPDDAFCGSYLVPYSYPRLDAFAGYQSGMPSPAFYEALWNEGPEAAGERTLERIVVRLRDKKQQVSTADLISASSLARGLAHLRGHEAPARTDLLDAIAGALVKDGLEVPMPWSRRGPLLPHTDPLLVEVVAALSGERLGRLAPETPHPPLVSNVRAELRRVGLELPEREPPGKKAPASDIRLELHTEADLDRSRVLHRLSLLAIPGFERLTGPSWATDPVLEERWRLTDHENADAALVEASGWGATLESATAARLESRLDLAEGLADLTRILGQAVFVGLSDLAERALSTVSLRVALEPSFAELGMATRRLLDLWRHDDLFGAGGSATLATVLAACLDRGLWLLEGLSGPQAPAERPQLEALAALRDLARQDPAALGPTALGDRARSVFDRRAIDGDAPPAIRGGCLGALWSLGHWHENADSASAHAVRAVRSAALPETLGDFLAGLFALAREEAMHCDPLLNAIDEVVVGLDLDAFLRGLPALRLAFSYYPPLERELLARFALDHHGGDSAFSRQLLRLEADPEEIARGAELDARVADLAHRYGLLDEDIQ